jgi:FkbM family methyltransferase
MSKKVIQSIILQKYEAREAKLVLQFIKANDVVLEIGGGIGMISTLAAKTASLGSVTTVEANPHLIPLIKRQHKANNVHVSVLNFVVAGEKRTSKVKFYLRDELWISSMSPKPENYKQVVYVDVITLRELIDSIKPSAIIIDVEEQR